MQTTEAQDKLSDIEDEYDSGPKGQKKRKRLSKSDEDKNVEAQEKLSDIDDDIDTGSRSGKKRKRFSKAEDEKILEGVRLFKDSHVGMELWNKISEWSQINRTKEQIRNRYSRLRNQLLDQNGGIQKKQPVFHQYVVSNKDGPGFVQQNTGFPPPLETSNTFAPQPNILMQMFQTNFNPSQVPAPFQHHHTAPAVERLVPPPPPAPVSHPVHDDHYVDSLIEEPPAKRFKQAENNNQQHIAPEHFSLVHSPHHNFNDDFTMFSDSEESKKMKQLEHRVVELEALLNSTKASLLDEQQKGNSVSAQVKEAIVQSMREKALLERQATHERHRKDMVRLGHYVGDTWKDGDAFLDCEKKIATITEERGQIEQKKTALQNTKLSLQARRSSMKEYEYTEQFYEILEQENIYKIRLSQLKKEESQLHDEKFKLNKEKVYHLFEAETLAQQEGSPYNDFPVLQDRYLLMKLIAKGTNNTEVYKAYDLGKMRYVTCKLQRMDPNWSEPFKEAFVKGVSHEVQVHKQLLHPRIVKFYDAFKADNNTFVMILEYCQGIPLSQHMKANFRIIEAEARSIIAQLFSALKCLNQQPKKLVHFNLNPENILIHQGEVKLLDFGSCMELENEDLLIDALMPDQSPYVPPECITLFGSDFPAKITASTDVWSAGVILYQLLYGKKPFAGDSATYSEQTLLNIVTLEFPEDIMVSEEGKEFLRQCLTIDVDKRPDVVAMSRSSYIRPRLCPAS